MIAGEIVAAEEIVADGEVVEVTVEGEKNERGV